ncbi:hypothetical protein [Nocardioides sp. GY 10127]|uniref:hypothetical protein n=1 Tax=Nocardioides sp. GY 10127 TaxID=2569762 RepID=UPI0010A83820|nr:hypothetical protein [Nocardioides sp. GY 10127]TIC78764.1 hypothetical protein E8D37_18890 [Nocardioides sp. GY 10127]
MSGLEPWQQTLVTALGLLGSIAVAYITYRGARYTAAASREGARRTSDVDAQDSALQAWKDILQPYRDEVKLLRTELQQEREDRALAERRASEDRDAVARQVRDDMVRMSERIDLLTIQVGEWKRLAKTIARWATRLRDEILRLGGEVPATPDELLTLHAIEDAELDPPLPTRGSQHRRPMPTDTEPPAPTKET